MKQGSGCLEMAVNRRSACKRRTGVRITGTDFGMTDPPEVSNPSTRLRHRMLVVILVVVVASVAMVVVLSLRRGADPVSPAPSPENPVVEAGGTPAIKTSELAPDGIAAGPRSDPAVGHHRPGHGGGHPPGYGRPDALLPPPMGPASAPRSPISRVWS